MSWKKRRIKINYNKHTKGTCTVQISTTPLGENLTKGVKQATSKHNEQNYDIYCAHGLKQWPVKRSLGSKATRHTGTKHHDS